MTDNEIWKDIPGFEGQYQASSLGRIRSLDRYVSQKSRNGVEYSRFLQGQLLSITPGPRAYASVKLGKAGPHVVHRLVAHAFLGPQKNGMDVRHINGNARDNRLVNLCYGTRSENNRDIYSCGRKSGKLTPKQALEIRKRRELGEPRSTLAKAFGVSKTTVCRIEKRRSFVWI